MRDKPMLATKPGEVVVSRRLYRSGQSEYLINGRVGRLRDIQEMFMGVGLGPDSYAIIEQGRIGLILSTKPHGAARDHRRSRRRHQVQDQEAAGGSQAGIVEGESVARQRHRRGSGEAARLVEAAGGQGAALCRKFATRCAASCGRCWLARRASWTAKPNASRKRLEELIATEAQHAQIDASSRKASRTGSTSAFTSWTRTIRQNQNHLNLTALEVDRSENRIAFNRQRRRRACRAWRADRCGDCPSGGANRRVGTAELRAASSPWLRCARNRARLRHASMGLAVRAEARAAQIHESEVRIDALRQCAVGSGRSLLRLHGEQKQAEEALVHQAAALQKLETNESALLESSIQIRDSAERAAFDWEAANAQLSALQQQGATLQVRISGLRREREATAKEAEALRDSLSATRSRHSTLTQVLNDRSYTADAVQKLFAANERGSGHDFHAVGVLADYAEVGELHEAAIEQYLRDELEYVVVETFDHARAGVSLLREEVGGRATFFVDSLRNLRLDEYEPIVHFRAEEGVVSRLDKLVEFRDPLGAAAKQFLPRLKSAYLTDSASAAEKLARDNPQFAFVTPDGTCYQGRMVTGGRADEAGPLGMKRELRALDAEVAALELSSERTRAVLDALATDLRAAERSLEDVSTKQHAAERDVFAARHRHEQSQADLARLGLELTVCQSELTHIRQDVDNARLRAERAKHQLAAANTTRAEAEAESSRLAEELVLLRGSIQSEQNELAGARAELAALNERLSCCRSDRDAFAGRTRGDGAPDNGIAAAGNFHQRRGGGARGAERAAYATARGTSP